MKSKNKKVLVTGAAGFIGSHLSQALISEGYQVIGVDNLSKGSVDNLANIINNKRFTFIKKDIFKVSKTKGFPKVDCIVHLAAAKIPRYGNRLETLLVNTKGTETVLEIARMNNSKVILASTSDVYGKSNKLPSSEDSDLLIGPSDVARWAYAVSKMYDEHLCFAYFEKFQVPFVILRLFGIYGPKQHRSWWGGPQSLFIDAVLSGNKVEIHGTGNQSRTFLYIDDAIRAILMAIAKDKPNGQIINIGSSEEISISSLAKLIATIQKKPLKIKKIGYTSFTGKNYEDIMRKKPNLKKAQRLLGWQPKIKLATGIKNTIEWYSQNPR